MYLRRHEISDGPVDHAVTLKGFLVGELRRYDLHGEMSGAAGSGVSGMPVRIIDNIELCRRQGLSETFPD
ncbi:MAG: hypothetical protein HW386_160 [Gammaproteobacteria bacterium]|nr:hypothetical protein [Gammaproteobacteria bacterium]